MELQRVDQDEDPVQLDQESGQVWLGRGPLLQITEVTMSRKVASLEPTSDHKWKLVSNSAKACFYGESNPILLDKGEERILEDGDHLALAEGKFVYKVVMMESSDKENKGEKEKPKKKAVSPSKATRDNVRKLPAWMMKLPKCDPRPSEPVKPAPAKATPTKVTPLC